VFTTSLIFTAALSYDAECRLFLSAFRRAHVSEFLERLRTDNEPTRTALAMAEAIRQHTDDLATDDPGDCDAETMLLVRDAERFADALRLVLQKLVGSRLLQFIVLAGVVSSAPPLSPAEAARVLLTCSCLSNRTGITWASPLPSVSVQSSPTAGPFGELHSSPMPVSYRGPFIHNGGRHGRRDLRP
jgi:hypothetical protein